MSERKRKTLFWLFKLLGILVACAFPIWAILERFPLWVEEHGTGHTVSVGVILVCITLLIVFRNAVFEFIKDRFNLKHAPSLKAWFAILIVAYIFVFIGDFMRDLTTICWMGVIGALIGTFLTYISGKFSTKDVNDSE